MTGEELYNRYRAELAERGVGTDSWNELNETDRQAWDAVGKEIQPK